MTYQLHPEMDKQQQNAINAFKAAAENLATFAEQNCEMHKIADKSQFVSFIFVLNYADDNGDISSHNYGRMDAVDVAKAITRIAMVNERNTQELLDFHASKIQEGGQ